MEKFILKYPSRENIYFAMRNLSFAQYAIRELDGAEEAKMYAALEINDIISTICDQIDGNKHNEFELEACDSHLLIKNLCEAQDSVIRYNLDIDKSEESIYAAKELNDIIMQISEQLAEREMNRGLSKAS